MEVLRGPNEVPLESLDDDLFDEDHFDRLGQNQQNQLHNLSLSMHCHRTKGCQRSRRFLGGGYGRIASTRRRAGQSPLQESRWLSRASSRPDIYQFQEEQKRSSASLSFFSVQSDRNGNVELILALAFMRVILIVCVFLEYFSCPASIANGDTAARLAILQHC